jgi:RimJ/RimL family protein N-acetyltransferase
MRKRFEYILKFTGFEQRNLINSTPANISLRVAQITDSDALAELMIEAYRGTIDYDGETLNDAIAEVRAFFAAQRGGEPLVNISRLAFTSTQLIGACLVADWQERQSPLIAYVMTHVKWKNQGIGKILLGAVLQNLHEQDYQEVRAVITEGNDVSERLFARMGFQKVQTA